MNCNRLVLHSDMPQAAFTEIPCGLFQGDQKIVPNCSFKPHSDLRVYRGRFPGVIVGPRLNFTKQRRLGSQNDSLSVQPGSLLSRSFLTTSCAEVTVSEDAKRIQRDPRFDPTVYFIADVGKAEELGIANIVDVVRDALAGGARMIQYRDKTDSFRDDKRRLACELLKLTQSVPGALLIINDDAALTAEIGADGVHLGQEDMPVSEARAIIGAGKIIGVSAGTLDEAEQGIADGADYLGIGPVYETNSKADAGTPLGLSNLASLTRVVNGRVPVVGIGGIVEGNCGGCGVVGCDGVAVIRALLTAKNVTTMAIAIRERFDFAATGPAAFRFPVEN